MKAGRELDALVAEKVMGFPAVGWEEFPNGSEPIYYIDGMNPSPVPHYSTDIAAAWEVVEKLISLDHYISVWSTEWRAPGRPMGPGWAAQVSSDQNTELSDTAPHAICLAALKAVGADISESLSKS